LVALTRVFAKAGLQGSSFLAVAMVSMSVGDLSRRMRVVRAKAQGVPLSVAAAE
jgi:hypothetical protein